MNKVLGGVFVATVILLGGISGFLLYKLDGVQSELGVLQIQNNELKNQIIEQETQLHKYTNLVKITNVTIEPGFNPYIGLTLYNGINVTIENLGVNDVEGLNLTIEHSSGSLEAYILEVLGSGETRTIKGALFSVVGITGWVTVTLKLNQTIIDEYIIPKFP